MDKCIYYVLWDTWNDEEVKRSDEFIVPESNDYELAFEGEQTVREYQYICVPCLVGYTVTDAADVGGSLQVNCTRDSKET